MVPPRKPALPIADNGASPILRDALNSVLPVSGLRLSGVAVPFRSSRGPEETVTVALSVDGRDLTFKQESGSFVGSFELVIASQSHRGNAGPSEQSVVSMPLEAASYATVAREGIRIIRTIALRPGRYQLRIGAMDRASQRTGLIHCDIDVPDFQSLPFSMSGLLVTSSLAGMVPTAPGGPLADLQKRLPGPPTLSREFHSGEQLALYAEVYDNQRRPHDVALVTTVLAEDGREVYRHETSVKADRDEPLDPPGGRGRIVVNGKVPLRKAVPGRYLLRVEAQSRLAPNRTVRREMTFRIVP